MQQQLKKKSRLSPSRRSSALCAPSSGTYEMVSSSPEETGRIARISRKPLLSRAKEQLGRQEWLKKDAEMKTPTPMLCGRLRVRESPGRGSLKALQ